MISKEHIDKARDLVANGTPEAVGYRVLIKPLDAVTTLEKAEMEKFEALASLGFVTKTSHQADRESKGTHHGILVHIGPGGFKGDLAKFGDVWPKVGDVVILDRYTGTELELPPGSGDKYRFANDEAILGVMR
jgi:co-chaperonin GroES (HSP10)